MLVWEYLLGYGGGLFFNYWRNEELGWMLFDIKENNIIYLINYFWFMFVKFWFGLKLNGGVFNYYWMLNKKNKYFFEYFFLIISRYVILE